MRTVKRALLAAAAVGVATVAGSLAFAGPASAGGATCSGAGTSASTTTSPPTQAVPTVAASTPSAASDGTVKLAGGAVLTCQDVVVNEVLNTTVTPAVGTTAHLEWQWKPAQSASVEGEPCGDDVHNVVASVGSVGYKCAGTNGSWRWEKVPPVTAPPTTTSPSPSTSVSPSRGPRPSGSQSHDPRPGDHGDVGDKRACADGDHGFTKFNNSVAFECVKVGKSWQWKKISSGTSIVGTSCDAVDHGVRLFHGDFVHECAPSNVAAATVTWKWIKVVTINGSPCSTGDHGYARLDSNDQLAYACNKVGSVWKWTRTATLADKICAASFHGVTIVNGNRAFECRTVPTATATVTWKWCDTEVQVAPTTITVGSPCDRAKNLKPVLINGKPCTCGQATTPAGVGASTPSGVDTWQTPAAPANAPDTTNVAENKNLAVTGSNTVMIAGIALLLVGAGIGFLLLQRRRKIHFTA